MPMIQRTIIERSAVMEGLLERTKGGREADHKTSKKMHEAVEGEAQSGMPVPPVSRGKHKRRNVYVEGIHPHPGKPLVEDTLIRTKQAGPRAVHLEGLIVRTTGENPHLPVNGIITQTTRGAGRVQDSVMKHHGEKVKTQPQDYGQVPYAGKFY